ncbi:C4-dicarboxylate ABC transporter permease [Pseudoclavibacter endophyticus]|uniref:TRAP transporter large permease n=1 Tax=Pseudoclavibacter endophyticus TaxID=1778590 RepID=A0A6H9WI43_9MICO|nr:TRAP transporter large permease [Pseudoclavibacter endophyticus]KAB1648137.1 TRAP transporter large permease [Pseudoclavibacter endophyticus]GGA70031.1 C4-dicarboxylate ABC transporter permease [Pseudoclavibacter endophyticus]
MTVEIVILLTIVLLFALLAVRFPIALALGISGSVGLILLQGTNYATASIVGPTFANAFNFTFTIIPMFILMGLFAVRARVAEYVFQIAAYVTRKVPGGLGVATVMACAGFAAVSGSSIGTAATMSKLSVGEMRKHGYPASFASALVAVSGTLGVMIPPSTFLVLYAIMTETSVAQILAAGVLPGLLSAAGYVGYIMVLGQRKIGRSTDKDDIEAGLVSASTELKSKRAAGAARRESATVVGDDPSKPGVLTTVNVASSWRELPWRGLLYIVILFGIVLGGMYSGVFTATESAAIGAVAAVLILLWERRKLGLKGLFRQVREALLDTGATTSMVFFIVFGSVILSQFFVAARVPQLVRDAVLSWNIPPLVAMGLLLLCIIPLGMFLESLSILVITVPILWPIALEFAGDLLPGQESMVTVWLGILVVKLIEVGMVTPPVGINAFVVAGVTRIRSETVFKGVLPLFIVDVCVLLLLFFIPAISLFLPSLVSVNAG